MIRLTATLVFLLTSAALAAPAPGETFPSFEALDVRGERTRFEALLDKRPTLVVAITDRNAEKQMRKWFEAASSSLGAENIVSIVSVDLGGWLSSNTARKLVRGKVPEAWRSRTLFDSNKRMGKLLELDGNPKEPWVFVLDSEGRVLARAKGPLSEENSREMFEAYSSAAR